MTPFPIWIATGWGELAVVLLLMCAVCWALMAKKVREK
jgi:hypothetical protein